MGNGASNRRNGRIQHNPVAPPPPPRIPPPPGYPGNVGPPPYPPPFVPNGHHMPYLYPPSYNGPMSAPMGPPFYMPPTNGQYTMNLPPPSFRVPHPAPPPHVPPPVAEAQRANTIRNDVNLKKPTLRLEQDEENPGFHLVAFTFDATVAGRSVRVVQYGALDFEFSVQFR
ncbi:hypothetical protein R1sor_021007 [Riccia sorocarpa]|uniref:RING-type E3 ubiquitin transferase n=1 Tax=Riccia sorocarpa TaxID=122646 RepID=A0ABD3GHA5_9MARC